MIMLPLGPQSGPSPIFQAVNRNLGSPENLMPHLSASVPLRVVYQMVTGPSHSPSILPPLDPNQPVLGGWNRVDHHT